MKRSVIFLTSLLFAAPALADNAMMSSGSMNHMSGGMMANSGNCRSMMDQARPKMDAMADSAMKTKAMGEMKMAEDTMSKGQEKSCMSHMHKAMGMMH